MLSTVPVKAAAALPAALHGVEPPAHEQPQSRGQGRMINAAATIRRMPTFSQNCAALSGHGPFRCQRVASAIRSRPSVVRSTKYRLT